MALPIKEDELPKEMIEQEELDRNQQKLGKLRLLNDLLPAMAKPTATMAAILQTKRLYMRTRLRRPARASQCGSASSRLGDMRTRQQLAP